MLPFPTFQCSMLPTASTALPQMREGNLPREATDVLLRWFLDPDHITHPYPSVQEKLELAKKAKLHATQIRNFYTNIRKRHWTPVVKKGRAPRCELEHVIWRANSAPVAVPPGKTELLMDVLKAALGPKEGPSEECSVDL